MEHNFRDAGLRGTNGRASRKVANNWPRLKCAGRLPSVLRVARFQVKDASRVALPDTLESKLPLQCEGGWGLDIEGSVRLGFSHVAGNSRPQPGLTDSPCHPQFDNPLGLRIRDRRNGTQGYIHSGVSPVQLEFGLANILPLKFRFAEVGILNV